MFGKKVSYYMYKQCIIQKLFMKFRQGTYTIKITTDSLE